MAARISGNSSDRERIITSTIKPRRTIAYHALLDKGTEQDNLYYDSIRESYDGTLFIRSDMMAWNVMKDEITERMAVATGNAWGVPGTTRQPPPRNLVYLTR